MRLKALPEQLSYLFQVAKGHALKVVVGVACLAIASTFYYRHQYSVLRADPQREAQRITDELIAEVSRLVRVPDGEIPTIATISDVNRLKGQPFFANAKNGDRVLIYSKIGKAVLYRPSEGIIVDIAPLSAPAQ